MTKIVDAHMHIYESKEQGLRNKTNYQIWEYGRKDSQRYSNFGGDLEDALSAMRDAGYDHGVVVNLFAVGRERDAAVNKLAAELLGEDRKRAIAEIDATMGDRLKKSNLGICDQLKDLPNLTPFVAADPWALSPAEGVAHLRDMVENHGAKGIKVHPILQHVKVDGEYVSRVAGKAAERNVPLIIHAGGTGRLFGLSSRFRTEPVEFSRLASRVRDAKIVVAHMGLWECPEIIRQVAPHQNIFLDVSFQSPEVLKQVKLMIPVSRLLLGSDSPVGNVSIVMENCVLAGYSESELRALFWDNPRRLLGG